MRVTADAIREFSAAMLVANTEVARQRSHGPGFLDDYVRSTRTGLGEVDAGRSSYFLYALAKLAEGGPPGVEFPKVHFVHSLNKSSSVVDIGDGPVLVIDDYLAETLEAVNDLFVHEKSAAECGALALRILAEQFIVAGEPEMGSWVALGRSAVLSAEDSPGPATTNVAEAECMEAVQHVFLLAHELGHVFWDRAGEPAGFSEQVGFRIDAAAEAMAAWAERYGSSEPLPDDDLASNLSAEAAEAFSQLARAGGAEGFDHHWSSEVVEADRQRRRLPGGPFIEELWADFYASRECLELFLGNWPVRTVYRGMCLALCSLGAVLTLAKLAENRGDWEALRDFPARRRVLLLLLQSVFSDPRFSKALQQRTGVTAERLDVDFTSVALETEQRFNDHIWGPMLSHAFRFLHSSALPPRAELLALHASLESQFGPDPALYILRATAIDADLMQATAPQG
jgi:hypothetical protein